MTGAALSQSLGSDGADARRNGFVRAVWVRLSLGALLAAASAWLVVMAPPLRSALIVAKGDEAAGISLWGVALVASPLLIWAGARVFVRGADAPLAPPMFWLFAACAGGATSTLALIFLGDSVVSVFVLAAAGFAAVSLGHRVLHAPPSWASAAFFIAAGLLGEWIINAVLAGTWPFMAVDLAALGLFALLILIRGGACVSLDQSAAAPSVKGALAYAAMCFLTLADAAPRAAQASDFNAQEPRS